MDADLDGGIVFSGLVPKRPDDRFGAAFIYARFSDSLRAFDQDQVNYGTLTTPPRDYEANFEVHLCRAGRAGLDGAAGVYIHRASERHRHPLS